MTTCPKCGHKFADAGRRAGGKARWSAVSPAKRSAIMRAVRKRAKK